MNRLIPLALLAATLLAGCATGPKPEDHAAHHPPGASAATPAAPTPGQMDSMMKSMQEMHDKMMAAKTPEERTKLMQEHMKLMHEGMTMMGQMRGGKGSRDGRGMSGGMPMGHEMMVKRMDMMEMMMKSSLFWVFWVLSPWGASILLFCDLLKATKLFNTFLKYDCNIFLIILES